MCTGQVGSEPRDAESPPFSGVRFFFTSPSTGDQNQHTLDATGIQLVLDKICVNQSGILVNCLLFLCMLGNATISNNLVKFLCEAGFLYLNALSRICLKWGMPEASVPGGNL